MTRLAQYACAGIVAWTIAAGSASAQRAATAQATAPVDLTGYWVSVITEDWAWRMRTPPRGDYASVPLNAEGIRVAELWSEEDDGSCLAFGAAASLRMPTRVRIRWADEQTLELETDNGRQTRHFRFDASDEQAGPATLQGHSVAAWQTAIAVTGSGATAGILTTNIAAQPWASLKVVTTNMRAAWLRPNGVPYSEDAVLTEYFDVYAVGDDTWFTVTIRVDDPAYLTEPLMVSSNFKREPDGARWNPTPCRE